MLDPAIILDLQRAIVPPALTPPALVREWKSPLAIQGERDSASMLSDAESQTRAWRSKVAEFESNMPRTVDLVWSDQNLGDLDSTIRFGERLIQDSRRAIARMEQKAARVHRRLLSSDPAVAFLQKRHVEKIGGLLRKNLEVLSDFVVKLRAHRALVDTRTGAEPGYVHRPWTPNAETIAAMKRARAGGLEPVTLDDLRAAILADD